MSWRLLALLLCGGAAAHAQPVTHEGKHVQVVARDAQVAEAKAQLLDVAAAEFERLLGSAPPRGRVTLLRKGQPGTGVVGSWTPPPPGAAGAPVWTLPWFDPPRNERPGGIDLMTHEAGHMMFIKWVERKLSPAARARADRYASKLPDWFDEGAAVALEPPHMRKERRYQIRARASRIIPLKTFFTQEHPLAEELAQGKATPAVFQRKARTLELYYGQSMAVLEFIEAERGVAGVREVLTGLCANQPMDEIIADWDKLKTVKSLERAYKRWIVKTYPRRPRR